MTTYRYSRSTEPANAPQFWHWAVLDGDPKAVFRELTGAIRPHVHVNALVDVVAELRAVFERIQTCTALDPDHIKNITRNRDLFEVRFQLAAWGLVVRIYETEIPELPQHVVALLAHQKVVDVGDDEIADLQNAEIDEATRRWVDGRPHYWGLP